jgi:spore maturation protein CgeB
VKPVKPQKVFASDIAFIGTGHDPARANFLLKIGKRYDLKVWGRGWEEWRKPLAWKARHVDGKTFAAICSSSKIVLNVSATRHSGEMPGTTSDRPWMVILAGGFFLGHGTPEMKHMLREGDHCAWYTDVDSCLAQCGYYLENAASRERIRREGQVFVRANHTYDQRIQNLLSGEAFVNPLG